MLDSNRVLELLFTEQYFEKGYETHFGNAFSPHIQFRVDGESFWLRWVQMFTKGNDSTDPEWNLTLERFDLLVKRLFGGNSAIPLETDRFSGNGGTALHRIKSRAIAAKLLQLGANWRTLDYDLHNALEAQLEKPHANANAVVCIMLAISSEEFVDSMSIHAFVGCTLGCSSEDPFIFDFLERYLRTIPIECQTTHLANYILALAKFSHPTYYRFNWLAGLESVIHFMLKNISKYLRM